MYNLEEIKKDTVMVPYTCNREAMRFMFKGEPLTVVEIAKKVNKTVGMVYYRLKMGVSPESDVVSPWEENKYLIEGIEFTINELAKMWKVKWSTDENYNPYSMIYGRIKQLRKNNKPLTLRKILGNDFLSFV